MLVFQLADRWGESDPRKIAAMPAHILNHWRAYFKLQGMTADAAESAPVHQLVSPRKAVLICSVLTLCECWEMADTAQLVVGLQLNDTNFKTNRRRLTVPREQSAKFNRQAQQDAKKTDESYQRIGGTLGGLAGKLAGWLALNCRCRASPPPRASMDRCSPNLRPSPPLRRRR